MNKLSEKLAAVEFIHSLSDKEFVEFFYEVTAKRNVRKDFGDEFDSTTWIVCVSDYGIFRGKAEPPYTLVASVPSPESAEYKWVQNEKRLLNCGSCEGCGIELTCVAKEALCPVCGSLVGCT